jgi:hypothetical protein
MRHAAAKVAQRAAAAAAARAAARRIMQDEIAEETAKQSGKTIVHHVNTLLGHPAQAGGRGIRQSYFPMLGLPRFIYNAKKNLMLVDTAKHAALHTRAYIAEVITYFGTHPVAVAIKGALNIERSTDDRM